jgi:hypothetical protein
MYKRYGHKDRYNPSDLQGEREFSLAFVQVKITSLCEKRFDILERLEFKCIAGWVKKKHRCLLARLPLEANVRLDDEFGVRSLEPVGERVPLAHAENDAEMATRHIVAIDVARFCHRAFVGRQMRHNLVSIKIEINPMIGRTSFFATEQIEVELSSGVEIVGWEGEMEGLDWHGDFLV